ncbi:hemicentin-2-like isoform X3 [Simochromis diagramma]|uniref:hemicentin-2-like isoform X1 n=1 Tax=Simochromis diagramma TaxID=43689 RepID=UPI001A7E9B7A|nr:hemicentin-2-like isoform X1 [Simochromis diagramma]XP_039890845.1 hemicentin-2-like isoform X2 [Simochromis diagramma]XP_039890846.1 hemicentin-2-like isoform X3 [Simochromis diagramma]
MMFENQQYTLQCSVQNVAPVQSLTVTFYRGNAALGHLQSNSEQKKPVNETFTLNITPSRDDGAQYWCEAKLELGPAGPQRPPVVTSEKLPALVHWCFTDPSCTECPVFTPSALVVKYGDPASVTCDVCQKDCSSVFWGLDHAVGKDTKNGTTMFWTVDRLTDWDPFVECYYITNVGDQCSSTLDITIYQPPGSVSISFVNHTEMMFENQQYTLQCSVQNVAPVQSLTVTFYRGNAALGHLQSNSEQKKPVNETFTLNITPSREDDGAQYWCEAKLELGPAGPQRPPVVTSEKLPALVHWCFTDPSCTEYPVFTPSALVVKYGDPASVTCDVCQKDCTGDVFGLDHAVGKGTENGTTMFWTVDRLTDWDPFVMCYYFNDAGDPCTHILDITIYQPPGSVSISFVNHTEMMFENQQYTLQCSVQNVAPVQSLTVTFYRGNAALGHLQSNSEQKKPVNETFTLNITPSREDDGAQYWCEAELELGPAGPQRPPVVTSEKLPALVHYGPELKEPPNPDVITITEGDTLHLNCSSVGNPSPSCTWTRPTNSPSYSGSVLTIKSVGFEHEGQYICTVRNTVGTVTKEFNIDVQVNSTPYIISGTILGALVLVGLSVGWYCKHN